MLYIYPCTSTYRFCTNIFISSNVCLTLFIELKCFILWGMHVYDSHKIKKNEKGVRDALGLKNEDGLGVLFNLCYYFTDV